MLTYRRSFANDITLNYAQQTVSEHDKKEYGFITCYSIADEHTTYGKAIQKYTGHVIEHPGAIGMNRHREVKWIYSWIVDGVVVSGEANSMKMAVQTLVDLLIEKSNVQA